MPSKKWCFVPKCTNTSTSTPGRIFLTVPIGPKRRKRWFDAVGRDVTVVSPKSVLNCCEDHFNLENDMENYMEYKMSKIRARMKPDVVPHRFACHPEEQLTLLKKRKLSARSARQKDSSSAGGPSTEKFENELSEPLVLETQGLSFNKACQTKQNGATSTSQASSLQASTSSTHALPISEGDIKIEIEEEKLFDPSSREYIEYPNTAKRARIEDDTTNVPTICSVKQEIEDATEDQDLVEAIEVKKEPGDDEPDVADYLSVAQIKMEIGEDFVG